MPVACTSDDPGGEPDPIESTAIDSATDEDSEPVDSPTVELVLEGIEPGRAGRVNILAVAGAKTGANLVLSTDGVSREPVAGCPTLTSDTDGPVGEGGADGAASLELFVDAASAGATVTYTIVQPDGCLA